jgi:flagellar biosynthesis chaperone FliJ
LDTLTLSLVEKKKELDAYAHKAQEVADTLDVASTKLISHFSDFANLEQTLQETLRSGIEGAAHQVAHQASHNMQMMLTPMQETLNDTVKLLHHHTDRSLKTIRTRKWLWMTLSGCFGSVIALGVALLMLTFYSPKTSEMDQKLKKVGHMFMQYYETLSSAEQERLLKKLSNHME